MAFKAGEGFLRVLDTLARPICGYPHTLLSATFSYRYEPI